MFFLSESASYLKNYFRSIFVSIGLPVCHNDLFTLDKKFSGLYVYHIPTSTWRCIWADGEARLGGTGSIRGRIRNRAPLF